MRILAFSMSLVLVASLLLPFAAAQNETTTPSPTATAEPEPETEETSSSNKWSLETYLDEAHSWGTFTITVGPEAMTAQWEGLELGDTASSDLRGLADGALSGEQDGVVDAQEADDFLFALGVLFEQQFGRVANHHGWSGIVLIDQAEPQQVEVTQVEATGLEGPVDVTDHVTATLGVKVAFPNLDRSKDVHTVRLDLGNHYLRAQDSEGAARLVGDLTLVVRAVDDWALDPASVQPECAVDNHDAATGALVFTAEDTDCFTDRAGILLTFAITGQGVKDPSFLPATGLLAATAALGAAASLARRRV